MVVFHGTSVDGDGGFEDFVHNVHRGEVETGRTPFINELSHHGCVVHERVALDGLGCIDNGSDLTDEVGL